MSRLLVISLVIFTPIIEILIFSRFSSVKGLLFITISQLLTAGVGFYVIRPFNINNIFFVEGEVKKGVPIVDELWNEVLLIFSGLFLIVPGLFTDLIGAGLLITEVRKWAMNNILKNYL
ncbi:MAG: UPF0716 protein FxsA [bacterium]|jgi:UPF0716 protein FxsA